MAKASGSINLNAMNDASKIATNCFAIDNYGIMIYNGSNGTTDSTHVTTRNILITSTDVLIRNGTTTLAKYGETTQIGANNTGHVSISPHGIQLYGSSGSLLLAEFKYDQSVNNAGTIADSPYFTLGYRDTSSASYTKTTYKIGDIRVQDNKPYVCTTAITTAEEWNSNHWKFLIGQYSTVLGNLSVASGHTSVAEGTRAYALGNSSHAEGNQVYAIGDTSHAQNRGTIANGMNQTVIGRFNELNGKPQSYENTDYSFIIGNGDSDSSRSNAFTVDWDGVVNAKGGYKVAGHTPIVIETVSDDNLTINANNNYTWNKTGLSKTGYTLAGIVGYGVTNSSSNGGNSSLCNVFLCQVSGSSSITMYVRNIGSATANVKLSANLLWVANGII